MAESIVVHDKSFVKYFDADRIQARVQALGAEIARDFAGRTPLFVVVLKGAYIFAADLLRACPIDQEVAFVQLSSYSGTQSTGQVRHILELNQDIQGRPVIIIEDIVDTGRTLRFFKEELEGKDPAGVFIVTLLHKPEAQQFGLKPDYIGFRIPNRFVIGYGLDFDEAGRHLPAIYQLQM